MIVIHIGLAKAGSSRLQTVLAQLESELADHGIHYPQIGRVGVAHHPLAKPLADDDRNVEDLWRELREFATSDRTVVVSSEAFETCDPGVVRSQLQGLDVRVVAYLRPATSRIPSFYSQNTKYGFNIADFDRFFDQMQPATRTRWLPGALAQSWAAAVGSKNVRFRALDPKALTGGTMERDFLDLLGLPTALALSGPPSGGDNLSPAWKTLEALRVIFSNAFTGKTPRQIRNDRASWAFARSALEEAQSAAEELGWVDRGHYLSHAQQTLLVGVHNREVELLGATGVDAVVPSISIDETEDREFLPTATAIPKAEMDEFMHRVGPRLLRGLAHEAAS